MINLEFIITAVTPIVTYIFGVLAKKYSWFQNKYIRYQNIVIGVISSIIYVLSQEEYKLGIAILLSVSGLVTGSVYDIVHDCRKNCLDNSS